MDSILDLNDKFVESDAIKSYEYGEYLPTSGSNLNTPGTITIHIESQDEFYHPRRSYLYFEGDILKNSGARHVNTANIALANNGLMHLFSNVKYEIAGQEIESVNNPGIAGLMLGSAKFPLDYVKGAGMMQCWAPDTDKTIAADQGFVARKTYMITKSVPVGSFSFVVELENVFGFCEDYDKVTYGMRHKLTLVRKEDTDALYRDAGAGASKVVLSKIALMMPRVHPSDARKFELYKQIESKMKIDCGFRMRQCCIAEIPGAATTFDWRLGVKSSPEKPRHILIAFQKDKSGDQTKNIALFDHLQTVQISITLNDVKYPARDLIADFAKHRFMEYYKNFIDFTRDYYGLDPLTVVNFVDPLTYKEEFPIFYFDVSKQSERLTEGVVDIKVRMRFKEAPGINAVAHALVISDRRMFFESDGRKMNILY